MILLERQLFGYPIRCQAEPLDEGLSVLLTGGCRTHVGAVTAASPGSASQTMTFPGHKDQYVSRPWAEALAEKTKGRVCVVCGIHYDHASQEQIQEILRQTEEMLQELLRTL